MDRKQRVGLVNAVMESLHETLMLSLPGMLQESDEEFKAALAFCLNQHAQLITGDKPKQMGFTARGYK